MGQPPLSGSSPVGSGDAVVYLAGCQRTSSARQSAKPTRLEYKLFNQVRLTPGAPHYLADRSPLKRRIQEGDFLLASIPGDRRLARLPSCWWTPLYWREPYEYLYRKTPTQEMEVAPTPATVELLDGTHLRIYEAVRRGLQHELAEDGVERTEGRSRPLGRRREAAGDIAAPVTIADRGDGGLHGRIGDYLTIAGEDRGSEDWLLGSITDEQARTPSAAHVPRPRPRVRGSDRPRRQRGRLGHTIDSQRVTAESVIAIRMAPGDGYAIRLASVGEPSVRAARLLGR